MIAAYVTSGNISAERGDSVNHLCASGRNRRGETLPEPPRACHEEGPIMSGRRPIENDSESVEKPKKIGKKSYHHNDLRNALLTTALDLIDRRGGPHFSMRELAGALGVTHASAYRHFAGKAALMDALTAEGFRKLAACQDEELSRAPQDPLERFNALGYAYMRFAQENKGFFSLIFRAREDENPEQSSRILHNERALSTLVETIAECQRAGLVVDGDPVRIAGYTVLAPHGLAVYQTQGHEPLGPGNDAAFFPDIEAINALTILPLLVNPPKPEEVARRYFARSCPAK